MTGHHFTIFDTPIGRCGIVWGERGIISVQLPMGDEKKTRTRLQQRHDDLIEAPPPAKVQAAIDGIVELLEGKPNDLADVVLDLDGVPEFNRGVYDIARTIPPGKTMTYGDIAKKLGGVELSRDVGQALGSQPLSDRGAVPPRAGGGQQARRLLRQWRRGDETEDAGDRRRGREPHAEPVRLSGPCFDAFSSREPASTSLENAMLHRPLKLGVRFSLKASTPSRRSSVGTMRL